jgi:hypothetical protein
MLAGIAAGLQQAIERKGDPQNRGLKENNPLTAAVNGLREERAMGFEPTTSSLGS